MDRIVDAFPADRQNQIRTMLASSLKGVVAQTLCKRKPKGRVAALEILIVTRGISATIRDGKTFQIPSAMQIGGAQGMVLLNDSLTKLVREGVVEPQQAYDKAVDKEELLAKFTKLGFEVPRSDVQSLVTTLASKPADRTPAEPAPGGEEARKTGKSLALKASAAPAPGGEKSQISSSLTIGGQPFQCSPLKEAAVPEEPSVYVVLGVDQWGAWTVLDVGQTDMAGEGSEAAERQSCWTTKCPTNNLWFGLPVAKGSLASHRKDLEGKICAEHKPPCAPKR